MDAPHPLVNLLERASSQPPSEFATVVAESAHGWGARDAVVYLIDYGQVQLVPMPSSDAADRAAISVAGTLAGRAFRLSAPQFSDDASSGGRTWWVPIINGTARLGVLEIAEDSRADHLERWAQFANMVAELVIVRGLYGDVFEFVRRARRMTLAGEIQWHLVPPLSFESEAVAIAGAMEPCYDIGGDSFDYAVNGESVHVAMFDAMGHGVEAALCATLAMAAYRNARRDLRSLRDIALAVHRAVLERYDGDRFVTAVIAELDLPTGHLRWLNAGHPAPLLLRRGRLIKRLDADVTSPLGISLAALGDKADVALLVREEALEPGDRVLLFTDGVIEARRGVEFFTVERLAEFVNRETAAQHAAAETLRRLTQAILDHQDRKLQDDATVMLVEWRRNLRPPRAHAKPGRS